MALSLVLWLSLASVPGVVWARSRSHAHRPAPRAVAKAKLPAVPPPPPLPPPEVACAAPWPILGAQAAVLVDAQTGQVLWTKNPHEHLYPASLTKMMTGLVAVKSGHLERVVTCSRRAASTGESTICLVEGERLKLREALQASLIKSANDATVLVAESVGKSVGGFVDLMNREATTLGLHDTHFTNPHGLHNPNHYSSAWDLAIIARTGMLQPEFAKVVGTREATIPWTGKPWRRQLVNRNRLLLHWAQCDGVKTGYTKHAGRCLAASASANKWRLLCVVLKCNDTWRDAQTLLMWGYYHFRLVPLAATTDPGFHVRVTKGTRSEVLARPECNLSVVVRKGQPPPSLLQSTEPCEAPLTVGQPVGTLYTTLGDKGPSVRLLAAEDVPESLVAKLMRLSPGQFSLALLACLAAGVLLHGARTKTVGARRDRLPARERGTHPPRQSDH
jgi:serine-type D-Ala-D-Ala carboxypeptidase (penicillin-binding protein 5/6)